MVMRSRWMAWLPMLALAACDNTAATPADGGVTDVARADAPVEDAGPTVQDPNDCDPLDEHSCAMPWPSNLYLRTDAARPTGYALRFGPTSLPQNRRGHFVDASSLSFMDGYGVGTPIMTIIPRVDIASLATEDHIERSIADDSPTLLFEVAGTMLRRVPHWVELDVNESDADKKTLFLRPAVILKENTRYIVAFRNLRTTAGAAVTPSRAFTLLRDGMGANDPRLAPRQARFTQMFTALEGAGVPRASLTLAWDFNTASSAALHGRMLAMRDDALMRVGPQGPAITINDVRTFLRADDGSGRPFDANIGLELGGTIEVPDYTVERRYPEVPMPGRELNLDAMGRPVAQGTTTVPFIVRVPHSALGGEPHGLVLYGHGLLGSNEEVRAGHLGTFANTNRFILVAASLAGMSEADIGTVFTALNDMSYFRAVGQRLHQGMIQWVLLARAVRERLGAVEALTSRNVRVNRDELYYSGNSQGGIFGGTFMAVSPDVTRGHLGVPGNNYATLLHRSTDFVAYFTVLRGVYAEASDLAVVLGYTQLQWDGTDSVSYLRHISAEPFANTPSHAVILGPAKGDYQVAVVTNEIAARTDIGIPLMANYDRERMPWGCTQAAYPRRGSGVVLYDFGNAWPTIGNHPPARDMAGDPHESPRRSTVHQRQIANFFRTGEIIDVCGGDGCRPD
jgi:hypothetical protein